MGSKYTAAELRKKVKAELLELVETEGIELEEGDGVGDIRAKLLEIEVSEDDEELDDDEVDDSDEVDDTDDELDDDEEDDIEDPEVDDIEPAKPAKAKAASKKTKYTEGGKDGEGNKLLGAKEVAAHIGTDAKTLRQFFRSGKSSFEAVGAGGRYEFNEVDLPKIKAEFEGWKTNKPGRGRATSGTSTKKRGKAQPKAEEVIDEVEEIEDLDELDDDIELDD